LLRARPSAVDEISLPTQDGPVRVGVGASNLSEDLQAVRRHLLPLPVDEIHRVLDAVGEQWGTNAASPPDARTLTPAELGDLARSDVVTIGAHTTDHVRLRGLPAQVQQETISSSKDELERLSGRTISHFAYPYGGPDSFDDHSVDAVRRSGFDTACTTIAANARSTSDPHQLPRRLVMNWGRLRFRVSLERWRLVTRH
jgi:peptidoglycan/xylan/chitin deacetylase (PgdA/CDA1 family)